MFISLWQFEKRAHLFGVRFHDDLKRSIFGICLLRDLLFDFDLLSGFGGSYLSLVLVLELALLTLGLLWIGLKAFFILICGLRGLALCGLSLARLVFCATLIWHSPCFVWLILCGLVFVFVSHGYSSPMKSQTFGVV